MSNPKKPSPTTERSLALLTPEAGERQLLNAFLRWHDLFRKPDAPRMVGFRQDNGNVWIGWMQSSVIDKIGTYLIVDVLSGSVVALMKENFPTLQHGSIFEIGRTYRLVPLPQA